ncbi:16833_t:CDS:2 [Funneliformis geosporum]|uniref:16833_t:CDS:1 n=1 Tax=Funneliformis geosporum TaxID=1117311 RepID=A0A9W4WLT9_9GLOM|nr:16833_t:CDS:2 [Funneliformis geosporum]
MQLEILPNLSSDFLSLLKDSYNYDVIIKVKEKEFKAHSIILYARSNYFKLLLSEGRIFNEDNTICLKMMEIDPNVFEMIMIYIYTGIMDFSNVADETIFSFLLTTFRLCLFEATAYTQSYLVDHAKPWIQKNFSTVLNTIFKLANCRKLQNYCVKYLCLEAKSFFSSRDSLRLSKNILSLILDLDNLYIEEIDLWEYLLEWGITQIHNNFNHKFNKTIILSKWNIIQFGEALKKTLDPLIYRIRFREINPDDFYEKIKPYKLIIPNDIYDDLMSYYLIGTPTKIGMPSLPRRGKISRILEGGKNSIYDCDDFNLILYFGNGDLILDGVNGICDKSDYEFCLLNDDEKCFEAEELEIFSVNV